MCLHSLPRVHCPQAYCTRYAFSVKMILSVMRLRLSTVYAGGHGMWPEEDATSWCNDAASDCLAFPVLFRKYQSPPTQSPCSPVDANVPPVACRIWGMLFEILSLYTVRLIVPVPLPAPLELMYYHWGGYAPYDGSPLSASHDADCGLLGWCHKTKNIAAQNTFSLIYLVAHVSSQVIWSATNFRQQNF